MGLIMLPFIFNIVPLLIISIIISFCIKKFTKNIAEEKTAGSKSKFLTFIKKAACAPGFSIVNCIIFSLIYIPFYLKLFDPNFVKPIENIPVFGSMIGSQFITLFLIPWLIAIILTNIFTKLYFIVSKNEVSVVEIVFYSILNGIWPLIIFIGYIIFSFNNAY